MIVATQLEDWLSTIVESGLPVLLSQDDLESFGSSAATLVEIVKSDPLLAMQILLWAKRLPTAPKEGFLTVSEAITSLGVTQILHRTSRLARLDIQRPNNKRLLDFVVDSMVAANLLKSWHDWRQVEWTEADYWACVFANAVWWLMAIKDPVSLEGIEYRVSSGEPVNQVFERVYGFSYQDLVNVASGTFMLPSLERIVIALKLEESPQSSLNFKYQALKYYLPISHQLAGSCREEFGSERYQVLVKKAANATLIDHFEARLPGWIAKAMGYYHYTLSEVIAQDYAAILAHCVLPDATVESASLTLEQGKSVSRLVEQLMNLLTGKCCFVALPGDHQMHILAAKGNQLEQYIGQSVAVPVDGWLDKMLTAPSSIRITQEKSALALGQLPEDIRKLVDDECFYMKSFSVGHDCFGLVYFVPDIRVEEHQDLYMQFRRLVALTEKNFTKNLVPENN